MSTEAQRASFPPRPTAPPRPSHPPAASEDSATDPPKESPKDSPKGERKTPGTSSEPATGPAAGAEPSRGGRPRFPSLGVPAPGATTPQHTGSASLPPPRASTRFPDQPPSVGREARTAPGAPQPPSRPRHLPTPDSVGRAGISGTQDGAFAQSSGRAGAGTQNGTSSQSTGRAGGSGPQDGAFAQSSGRAGAGTQNGTSSQSTGRAGGSGPQDGAFAQSSGRGATGTQNGIPSQSSGRAAASGPQDGTSSQSSGRPFRLSAPGRPDAAAGAAPETTGRPFRLPPPRHPGAPGDHASETTARLRPVPADPGADEPAAPFGRPAPERTTAARPGSARPTPPRPAHEPPVPAGTGTGATTGRDLSVPPAPTRRPAPSAPPLRNPAPVSPDPALSWSATRPVVSFGEPEGYDGDARPRPLGRRGTPRAAAAAACLVLGLGLISGAATGSWLVGGSGDEGSPSTFAAARDLWHSVPVDQLFPPTVQGRGAGPGGADRTWTRIAVAPDSGCKDAFDPLLRKALAPVGCERLLRATYTDATESYVTTVGLLFTTADAPGTTALANRFRKERLDRRSDLMPLPYAAQGTPAAGFGTRQRASWTVSVLTEVPVVVYAVSGWADGRTVDEPQPAGDAMEADATTAVAQAGLGNEAQGLADRVERDLRRDARSASEQPS
ncbi:hypothetical protein ABTX60_19045 [Streptomyces sp. NPDC126510]|uniref:hypothetical protein n=1 Tax=Streptomyces sp. NPDC126510 TaxID=3155317 RepID=UPI003319C309